MCHGALSILWKWRLYVRRKITFEDYVPEIADSFAWSAAWAACQNTGRVYNPLLISGMDHELMECLKQCILNHLEGRLSQKVIKVTAGEFCIEYLAALLKGFPDKYRDKFIQSDALIVDDLQELGLFRKGLQERFGNLLKAYFADYKQVVLFSDQPLNQINGLANPALISQFEWGLAVEMEEAC